MVSKLPGKNVHSLSVSLFTTLFLCNEDKYLQNEKVHITSGRNIYINQLRDYDKEYSLLLRSD